MSEAKAVDSFSESFFTGKLARCYDLTHQHRDYNKESRFVDQVVQKAWSGAKRILDVGCGTGEHAMRMAEAGYQVTAINASPDMLRIARKKAKSKGLSIGFKCQDFRDLDFDEEFEAAYCLGYTLLYMRTYPEAGAFLDKIHRALLTSGVFILDFLNGWRLIEEHPKRKHIYRDGETTVTRFDESSLNKERRLRHLEFSYTIQNHTGKVETASAEEDLRVFFEDEVRFLMTSHGFGDPRAFGDYSLDSPVSDSSWVVVISAHKK